MENSISKTKIWLFEKFTMIDNKPLDRQRERKRENDLYQQ